MSQDTLVSTQLGEYRLQALLGQGGMARVYLAVDVNLNRYAAVKVIDTPFRRDEEYMTRFRREAQAIARLEHNHIVRIYRYGEADDLLYMAMQFIEGASLETVLASYQADGAFIEPDEAHHIISEVCAALDYAHGQGVIHRDVKPGNILLNKAGQAFLADFGLALLEEVGTRGEIFGSPHYIAPEQAINSAGAVPQSDLYSLGVILFEMFTGQLPFTADEPLNIAAKHLQEDPPAPSSIRPGLSPTIEAVIMKALAKDKADRYQTGAELAAALDRAISSQPARPSTTLAHRSIPERIAIEDDRKQLPPLPAPVAASPKPPLSQPPAQDSQPSSPAKSTPNRTPLIIGCAAAVGAVALLGFAVLGVLLFGMRSQNDIASDDTVTSLPTLLAEEDAFTSEEQGPTASPESPSTQPTAIPSQPLSIEFATSGEDSLFLINRSENPLILPNMQLGGENGVAGSMWEIRLLAPNECVSLRKDSGNPSLPDVGCREVGAQLTRGGNERFWKDSFDVFYEGQVIGTCSNAESICRLEFTP